MWINILIIVSMINFNICKFFWMICHLMTASRMFNPSIRWWIIITRHYLNRINILTKNKSLDVFMFRITIRINFYILFSWTNSIIQTVSLISFSSAEFVIIYRLQNVVSSTKIYTHTTRKQSSSFQIYQFFQTIFSFYFSIFFTYYC